MSNQSKDWKAQAKIISLPFLVWLTAGFDLIQLTLLAPVVGRLFFPSQDPTASILAVYATFSLSLLARIFGGMFFGSLGDRHRKTSIITVTISSVTILMIMSCFLPTVSVKDVNISVPLNFIFTRVAIGFFIGGLWPTASVFAMEELYRTIRHTKAKATKSFENEIKEKTWQSAIMQVGLHAGYFFAAILIILSFNGGLYNAVLPLWKYKIDAWRFVSLIGGIIGLICSILSLFKWMKEKTTENKSQYTALGRGRIQELILNKRHRNTLFNFWLIMTGLMYMYYSTVIITRPLFERVITVEPWLYHIVLILLLVITLGAHLWLGWYCRYLWKNKTNFNNSIKKLCSKIPFKHLKEFLRSDEPKRVEENVDVVMIVIMGLIIIPIGLIGIMYYSNFPPQGFSFAALIFQGIVILVANSAWAVIQSLISSRFPRNIRNTAASLAYNGGLVICFASPFINMEFFLILRHEYLLFVPMVLGAAAMVIGGLRFINSYQKSSVKVKEMEIQYPSSWKVLPYHKPPLYKVIMPNSSNQLDDTCVGLLRKEHCRDLDLNGFMGIIRQSFQHKKLKIIHSSTVTLGGHSFYKSIFQTTKCNHSYDIHGYWTEKFGTTYMMIIQIKNHVDNINKRAVDSHTIENIVNSFEIKEPIILSS